MYVPKKFRTNFMIGEHILPIVMNETVNYQRTWVTLNSYNKPMYNAISRMHLGKSSSLTPWPDIYRKFKPIGQHVVNNTLQYVAEYERSIP
jgi:hypothetical protein